MLAYSREIEISRILHKSFAIAWGTLGVMILVLIPITKLIYAKRTLHNIPIGEKYFYFEMKMHILRSNYK